MNNLPIEQLIKLKKQGLENQVIFQMLMKQGFKPEQISEALRRIELNEQVGNMVNQPNMNMGSMPPNVPPSGAPNMPPPMQQRQQNVYQNSSIQTSQIAEAIIEEKWKALLDNVNKIITWKESMEIKINKIENDLNVVQHDFEKIHNALTDRMHDSESAVKNVGVDLKALTTVFEKILPGFIDNMHSLDRITKELSQIKNSSTKSEIKSVKKVDDNKPVKKKEVKNKNDDIFSQNDSDESIDNMF